MYRRTRYLLGSGLLALALSACGQAPDTTNAGADASPTPNPAASPVGDMDHGSMDHGGATAASDAPFDAMFIDSMIVHHQGAIDMAQQALEEAERPEIRALAQNVISAQEQEIEQMQQWREQWYPDLPETNGMGMAMGDMMVSEDTSIPFDQRFIQAMILHHQGAIDMARAAQQQAERPEIKQLADEIITAQEAEIAQMQQWLQEWYAVTQ